MIKIKIVALILLFVMLPTLLFSGCGKDKSVEFTVRVDSSPNFLDKVSLNVSSEGVSNIVNQTQGIHKYSQNKEILLSLRVNDEDSYNYYLNEENLNNNVVAYSKKYVDANQGEKEQLENYVSEISWSKTNKNYYEGRLILTTDIVITFLDSVAIKDVLKVLVLSNSMYHSYKFVDEVKETSYSDLNLIGDTINFEIDKTYFKAVLKDNEGQNNPPILKKVYYLYLKNEQEFLTVADLKTNAEVYEDDITYYYDEDSEEHYYETNFILLPESANYDLYTNEYRHLIIYFEIEI